MLVKSGSDPAEEERVLGMRKFMLIKQIRFVSD